MRYEIEVGGAAELHELAPLWQQMLAHHRQVVGGEFPVRESSSSWVRARSQYARWLHDGKGHLLLAREEGSRRTLGYVVYTLEGPGTTFDFNGPRGDVDSLVVADSARGAGIGTALLERVRQDLVSRGVDYWSVGVLAANADAERLYRRLGFKPWNQSLLQSTRAFPDEPVARE